MSVAQLSYWRDIDNGWDLVYKILQSLCPGGTIVDATDCLVDRWLWAVDMQPHLYICEELHHIGICDVSGLYYI